MAPQVAEGVQDRRPGVEPREDGRDHKAVVPAVLGSSGQQGLLPGQEVTVEAPLCPWTSKA